MTDAATLGLQIWTGATALTLWSTWYACLRKGKAPRRPKKLPPVSVLKPLCGLEPGLEANLESFFRLEYPSYEILFSVDDERDAAAAVARRVMSRYPRVRARLVVSTERVGPNPKVNNLAAAYRAARFDVLFLSDSNVRVTSGYLVRLVSHLSRGIGLVTSPPAATVPRSSAGWLEAAYVNTFFARCFHIARAWGLPLACGKAMVFRRTELDAAGGIAAAAAHPLADDVAILRALRRRGLRHVITAEPARQFVGAIPLSAFWRRHVRWGLIRKSIAPHGFPFEPFLWPITSGMGGAVAFRELVGFPAPWFLVLHLALSAACDMWLVRKHAKLSPTPALVAAWLAREALAPVLWAHAGLRRTAIWRDRPISAEPPARRAA